MNFWEVLDEDFLLLHCAWKYTSNQQIRLYSQLLQGK